MKAVAAQSGSGTQLARRPSARAGIFLLRVLVLLLPLGAAAVYEPFRLSSLSDADVWQHLRTGLWILQNHAVPHTGLFSQYSQLSWISSSWGFDALLAAAYKVLGLRALPLTLMTLKVAVALAAFLLARGLSRSLTVAVVLAVAVQCALPALRPLPYACSMVCFAAELLLIFASRRTGKVQTLYWLPVLFIVWVNLHVEFIFGLVVLGLWGAAAIIEELARRPDSNSQELESIPIATVAITIALCVAATLLSPYGFHVYEVVLKNLTPVAYVAEDHSMNFRQPEHYVLLLLAMAAYFALGRRHSRDLFRLALIVTTSVLAFRIQGAAGFLAMASVAVIADAVAAAGQRDTSRSAVPGAREGLAAGALLAIALVAAFLRIPSSDRALLNKTGETLPVRAADYIRQHQLPNPLFNEYRWGSFLTFYLPDYPVAIDDRTDLYGDANIVRYFEATNGQAPLNSDPTFAAAKTVLLPANSAVVKALAKIPEFNLVYSDDVAALLVRRD